MVRGENDNCRMENAVFRKRNTAFLYEQVRIVNRKGIPKEKGVDIPELHRLLY